MTPFLFLLAAAAAALSAQPAPVPVPPRPPCNSYTLKVQDHLSFEQKTCYWAKDRLLTGSAVFGAWFFSMVPAAGPSVGNYTFPQKFGTKYAQSASKSTAEYLIGGLAHEDPRDERTDAAGLCGQRLRSTRGIGVRLGQSILRTVWTTRDSGRCGIAYSRFGGALASGFVGMAWYPDPINTPGAALKRSATAFGGSIGASVFREFRPDLTRLANKIVGR
jgi:hypothetical protein